jgi:hypothetical protein
VRSSTLTLNECRILGWRMRADMYSYTLSYVLVTGCAVTGEYQRSSHFLSLCRMTSRSSYRIVLVRYVR